MRFIVLCLLFVSICAVANAQPDSLGAIGSKAATPHYSKPLTDSIDRAIITRGKLVEDSIAMRYLMPDSLRENQFVIKVLKNNFADINSFLNVKVKSKSVLRNGRTRTSRDPWIIATIIGLLIYTALLNIFLGSDVRSVVQSFYDKHALSQLDKEGGLINSWAFIGLFLLFSLAFGLVLYQLTAYYNVYYSINGFRLFISLSVIIGLLFAIKFLVLKFIGFVFDINKPVSQYIAILNLTYFNIAFVLLSVGVCFGLLANQFIPFLLTFTLALIAVIFAWQFIRNSVNMISNFRFHKFYLFIYLCALEICPILILIKALKI
jgi:hypothetical protein